jgi:hypothetical protein
MNKYEIEIENLRYSNQLSKLVKILNYLFPEDFKIEEIDYISNFLTIKIKNNFSNIITTFGINGYNVIDSDCMDDNLVNKINKINNLTTWNELVNLKNILNNLKSENKTKTISFKPKYNLIFVDIEGGIKHLHFNKNNKKIIHNLNLFKKRKRLFYELNEKNIFLY